MFCGLSQPLQSIPTEKITKKPIPEEHVVLKTTFEGLIQKCLAAASDPVCLQWNDNNKANAYFIISCSRKATDFILIKL